MRLFTAIRISQEAAKGIRHMQESLRPIVKAKRWQPTENIHLTLQFLGDVAEDRVGDVMQAMEQALVGQSAFSLQTGAVGAFPNLSRPRVLWVGVQGQTVELETMQGRLTQALSVVGYKEDKPYKAHITMAREVEGKLDAQRLQDAVGGNSYSWDVEHVYLFQSELRREGAVHTVLREFELGR